MGYIGFRASVLGFSTTPPFALQFKGHCGRERLHKRSLKKAPPSPCNCNAQAEVTERNSKTLSPKPKP